MRRHKRDVVTATAGSEFGMALAAIVAKYELTPIETAGMLQQEVAQQLKYALRFERHGDYDTPAGLEKP
jgi:hypothetical protein